MELRPSSSNDNNHLCQLCNESERRYVCPKCTIGYCSIECYKSTAHLECSESFYRKCVEEELHAKQCDPEMKQKTLDMLQRIYDNESDDDILKDILQDADNFDDEVENFDDEVELDSDDENVPCLSKRVENINLDDADELWSALTESERQTFEAMIKNGDASKLLPLWNPWWIPIKKKLIEDIENIENQSYVKNCPTILDCPAVNPIIKVSPFIKFNIINVVYAYAYTVLYFNGDHQTSPIDAVHVFLRICETTRVNKIFKSSTSAVESVLLEITNCDALSGDQESVLGTKEAGDAIINGPEITNKIFYILAALSDLHQLIHNSKKELSSNKLKSTEKFKNKFQSKIKLEPSQISKKNLGLLLKKIEFYIAWLKSQSETYNIIEDENLS